MASLSCLFASCGLIVRPVTGSNAQARVFDFTGRIGVVAGIIAYFADRRAIFAMR
jgi:hypothetical protein